MVGSIDGLQRGTGSGRFEAEPLDRAAKPAWLRGAYQQSCPLGVLLTPYAFYNGPFIKELFQLIRTGMVAHPMLQVRVVCNIHRDRGDTSSSEALIRKFQQQTWSRLWPEPPAPALFFHPRSLSLEREKAVSHLKAVVADALQQQPVDLVTHGKLGADSHHKADDSSDTEQVGLAL